MWVRAAVSRYIDWIEASRKIVLLRISEEDQKTKATSHSAQRGRIWYPNSTFSRRFRRYGPVLCHVRRAPFLHYRGRFSCNLLSNLTSVTCDCFALLHFFPVYRTVFAFFGASGVNQWIYVDVENDAWTTSDCRSSLDFVEILCANTDICNTNSTKNTELNILPIWGMEE